jgi:hypothetical protein
MDYVALALGLALPWLLGWSVLLAADWPRKESDFRGGTALRLGYGYVIGNLLLTFWMRAVSASGMHFSWTTIGAPLFVLAVLLVVWGWRRGLLSPRLFDATSLRSLPRWQRLLWIGLIAWLALRVVSLAVEVAWRPLYPWNAWTEWATKARAWYELGHIVPFASASAWLTAASPAYFDAAPGDPATVPLLQVWSCVALGRWDDSAMNWPWLLTLIALAISAYGVLRDRGSAALGALVGCWLIVSLPLLDVQVALAGYPDLMLATVYALAALALYRWSLRRDWRDACVAVILGLSCPLIKLPGAFWAITIVPGIVAALLGRRGVKLLGLALGAAILLLLAMGRWDTVILGRHLDFEPSWRSLVEGFFLLGNWHLLWYAAIVLAILGARQFVKRPLAPLAMIAAAALIFVFIVFSYPGVAAWIGDAGALGRISLPLAVVLVFLGVLLWNELTSRAPANTTVSTNVAAPIADA